MHIIKAVYMLEGLQFTIVDADHTEIANRSGVHIVQVTHSPIGSLTSEVSTIGLEFSDHVWEQAAHFYRSTHGRDGKHSEVDVIYQALMQFRN